VSSSGHPITAYAAVNGLGQDTATVLARLRAGEPGLSPLPEGTPFEGVCGAVTGALPPLPPALAEVDSRNNRLAHLALLELATPLAAARERWRPERIGLLVGSSTGSMAETEEIFTRQLETGALPEGFDLQRQVSLEALVRTLRVLTGAEGPASIISTACSSSGKVFASARRWLDLDLVDAVLVGGVDSLCQMTLRGFRSLSALSPRPARPFSAEREGINIGEGAAFLLLEREGEGPRLLGIGESADAHHMTAPDPEGGGARLAMERAMAQGGVSAAQIAHVNAHGTATQQNDIMEARAIRGALAPDGGAPRASVVSTKGYTGHMLGAAGATEAVFALQALAGASGAEASPFVPASLGALPLDPEIELDIAFETRSESAEFVLSNSFAFGGSNVSVLFGAPS
jgi:3-oxoacyl-[acyl-carrier-protein] synthase-1